MSKLDLIQAHPLDISLHDRQDEGSISPDRVPLSILRAFASDVDDLLKGSGVEIDTSTLNVSVFKGSLGVRTEPLANSGLLRDLRHLTHSQKLDGVDSKRSVVIQRWQKTTRHNSHLVYRIKTPALSDMIVISAETDFHADDADQWVKVERYLQGEIYEMGGKNKVNAHIRLPDGSTLAVESDRDFFRNDKVNRLYKPAMSRITAEYNVVTRKYRNARLLSFDEYQQTLDEQQLAMLFRRGADAWKDVPNATEWVESLRGGEV
jgi:hypothetical protein